MISFVSNNYNNPCLLPPSSQRTIRTQKSIFLNFTANITHQLQAAKDFPENLWQLYSFSLSLHNIINGKKVITDNNSH